MGLLLSGCGTWAEPSEDTSTSTTTQRGSSTGEDVGSFVLRPDGGSGPPLCDFLEQDCGAGLKCAAYDLDDDAAPDETQCVEIAPEPGDKGDPCQILDPTTGADDCDIGLTCLLSNFGDLRCVSNCIAPEGQPVCLHSDERCIDAGGPLKVCVPACDPLGDDCGAGRGCYPLDDWLRCLPDSSGDEGTLGDPCGSFINVCKPGLWCAPAEDVPGCEEEGCCQTFCRTDAPSPCEPDQSCRLWFPPGTAPAGLETLGSCAPA